MDEQEPEYVQLALGNERGSLYAYAVGHANKGTLLPRDSTLRVIVDGEPCQAVVVPYSAPSRVYDQGYDADNVRYKLAGTRRDGSAFVVDFDASRVHRDDVSGRGWK